MGDPADYNIAIMTGGGYALVVIDVDNKVWADVEVAGKTVRKGVVDPTGAALLANRKALVAKYGRLPRTVLAETPHGGRHFLYRIPKGAYVPCSRGELVDFVDVRGDQGYIAGPGSIVDGRTYKYATGCSPAEVGIADLPPEYLAAMTAQRPRTAIGEDGKLEILGEADTPAVLERAVAIAREWPEAVEGAGGHSTTIDLAHALMDLGCRPETAAAVMCEQWDERNAPPWGDDELCRLVLSLLPSRRGPIGCAAVENAFYPVEIAARLGVTGLPDGDGSSAARLPVMRASDFEGRHIPPRRWIVPDVVIDRNVTLFTGDGGTGKTLVALQLAAAVVTGREWLGMPAARGPVLFLSAEDETDELHRRLASICGRMGLKLSDLSDLHLVPLAGLDAVLATAPVGGARIAKTALWQDLAAYVEKLKPRVVFLDTQADVFAGDEIDRQLARQFIGLLRGLALEHDLAVMLLGHPSLDGMRSGRGTSGSTGWNNSVRGRLYLEKAKDREGRDLDGDLRTLSVKKLNYGPDGQEFPLRWVGGCFEADRVHAKRDKAAETAECERVFLDLLTTFNRQGRDVSPNKSLTYAPAVFSAHPEAGGFGRKMLADAMEALLSSDRIHVEKFGPNSKVRSRLVVGPTEGEA